jgi:hypothetical protein
VLFVLRLDIGFEEFFKLIQFLLFEVGPSQTSEFGVQSFEKIGGEAKAMRKKRLKRRNLFQVRRKHG